MPPFAQRADMLLVGMLVKGHQHVRFVSRAQALRPNRCGPGKWKGRPKWWTGMVMKVMTSCSLRPASRARKTADGLDAVLGIAGETNDGFGNFRHLRRAAVERRGSQWIHSCSYARLFRAGGRDSQASLLWPPRIALARALHWQAYHFTISMSNAEDFMQVP